MLKRILPWALLVFIANVAAGIIWHRLVFHIIVGAALTAILVCYGVWLRKYP
jgi:hypothetical protein